MTNAGISTALSLSIISHKMCSCCVFVYSSEKQLVVLDIINWPAINNADYIKCSKVKGKKLEVHSKQDVGIAIIINNRNTTLPPSQISADTRALS